jgi:hypothetical protein
VTNNLDYPRPEAGLLALSCYLSHLCRRQGSRQYGRRRPHLPPDGVALPEVHCDDWCVYSSVLRPRIDGIPHLTPYPIPHTPQPYSHAHAQHHTNTPPVGRDKLLRTLQYFSRFLAWYLYRTNRPASTISPFEATKKQFGATRKLMRVGKFVEHFRAAAVASDAKSMDPVLRFTTIGRQLGYAMYMLLDNACVVRSLTLE